MSRLWMVRLGKFGEKESHAIEAGELVTGWIVGDLSGAANREEMMAALQAAYPDEKPGTLQNWAAQLNQFKNVAVEGDLVVTPLKTTGQLAIGRLKGGYSHTEGKHPTRKVEWIKVDLPRGAVKQDLLYSLGASQTVCEISRNEAPQRLLAAANTGVDPGHAGLTRTAPVSPVEGTDEEALDDELNLATLARDQIEKRITTHFAGHAFTQLIAAILRAQGYQTGVSPPGPDRGIDIVAGQGALGMSGPKLVVQVKEVKFYVAFKRIKNFVCLEIYPQTRTVTAFLKVDPDSVVLEKGFTRDVRKIGHYGTGDLEVVMRTPADFAKAQPLLQRAYDES